MSEDTIVSLIDAGPFTTIAIAFLVISLVTLLLTLILYRMLKAFLSVQLENIEQTKLTREAIEKLDRNHQVEVQKLAVTLEAINLSLSRRNITSKKEFLALRVNINEVVKTLDNFIPNIVEALTTVIKENGDCSESKKTS